MEHGIGIIDYSLYFALFLLATALLQKFTTKIALPYTIALLLIGFLSQFINNYFHFGIHLSLSPDVIYFILLPVLLFEAAMHINIHQFKLQFKTITFFATIGLLISIAVIGAGLAFFAGIPFEIALLFGAIISATDPIAVIALFKELGAPKRLALVADGESMFNDATGVIAFRVISGFVIGHHALSSNNLPEIITEFGYVFLGSIILGAILGIVFSILIEKIKPDRVLITVLISALTLGSFAGAEHFFHLSGVITTVIAGITFGNLARGKMGGQVIQFLEEYFGYLGFLALSLVFFFASFNLDLHLFAVSVPLLIAVIIMVLLARAVSVYASAFVTNRLAFFKDEPNIPLSWQHILNWGGLRGVIPLVLVYSLPDDFAYKQLLLSFTFATLLFTLFVNGLTIRWLMFKLKLHLPEKVDLIVKNIWKLFGLDDARNKLLHLPDREFTPRVIKDVDDEIFSEEYKSRRELILLANPKDLLISLRLEALEIERATLRKLFEQGRFSESVFYEFESELDLQRDAINHPELYKDANSKGMINTKKSFRKRLANWRLFASEYPLLSRILKVDEEDIVVNRYSLLRVRLFTSYAVMDFLRRVEKMFLHYNQITRAIHKVRVSQQRFINKNKKEVRSITYQYPEIVVNYQKQVINQIIHP